MYYRVNDVRVHVREIIPSLLSIGCPKFYNLEFFLVIFREFLDGEWSQP